MNASLKCPIRPRLTLSRAGFLQKKNCNPEVDVPAKHILDRLMNPVLMSLHSTVLIQHACRTSCLRNASADMVAFTYAEIFREASTCNDFDQAIDMACVQSLH